LSAEKNKIYLSSDKKKRAISSAVTPKRLTSAKVSVTHSASKSRQNGLSSSNKFLSSSHSTAPNTSYSKRNKVTFNSQVKVREFVEE